MYGKEVSGSLASNDFTLSKVPFVMPGFRCSIWQNKEYRSTLSNGSILCCFLICGPNAMKYGYIFISLLSYPCTPNVAFSGTINTKTLTSQYIIIRLINFYELFIVIMFPFPGCFGNGSGSQDSTASIVTRLGAGRSGIWVPSRM